MAAIALVGLVPGQAALVEAALQAEGHTVALVALDADTVRTLARVRPALLVLDGHAYVNTRAFLTDLRERPETSEVPVVLLGVSRSTEVARFEEIQHLGRSFSLDALLAAVHRALGASYSG